MSVSTFTIEELKNDQDYYEACCKKLIKSINEENVNGIRALSVLVNEPIEKKYPLIYAIKESKETSIQILLGLGADTDCRNLHEQNALMIAIKKQTPIKIIKKIIEKSQIKSSDCYDRTAMHFAAQYGTVEIMEALFEREADINKPDYHGETPLMFAVLNNNGNPDDHECMIDWLLEKKANTEGICCITNRTALHYATIAGIVVTMKKLINHGANINCQDIDGRTPLIMAIDSDKKECITCLLENKADINMCDKEKNTPLHFACQKNNIELVKELIRHGANRNALNNNNKRPSDLTNVEAIKNIASYEMEKKLLAAEQAIKQIEELMRIQNEQLAKLKNEVTKMRQCSIEPMSQTPSLGPMGPSASLGPMGSTYGINFK